MSLLTILSQRIHLRTDSFVSRYPTGTLSVDTYDFIGTHHLIYDQSNEIVMAYRSISLSCCKIYSLPLPIVTVLENSNAIEHFEAVNGRIKKEEELGNDVIYASGFCVNTKLKKNNRRLFCSAYSLITDIHGSLANEYPEDTLFLCCSSVRYNTYKLFSKMGYEKFKHGARELPQFTQQSLGGDLANLLEMRDKSLIKMSHLYSSRRLCSNEF